MEPIEMISKGREKWRETTGERERKGGGQRKRDRGMIWWAAVFSPPFCRAQQIHGLSLSLTPFLLLLLLVTAMVGGVKRWEWGPDSQRKTLYHIPSALL